MFSRITKRKIRRSVLAGFAVFFIVVFIIRGFPLSLDFFDLENLTKIFVYTGVPAFALVYIIIEIIHKKRENKAKSMSLKRR